MDKDVIEFDQVIERGCAFDVHKEKVMVTIKGKDLLEETREYSTFTNPLTECKKWLNDNKITHIAMESTGVYWKPIYNILGDDFKILLVNARHVKQIPGHKTDKKDSQWLCKLLLSGLLKGSYIPPREIRELRDLNRYRTKLENQKTQEKNRVLKILEDCNIKLSSVLTDVFGASGTAIIDAILDGEKDLEKIANLSKGVARKKIPEIQESIYGNVTAHHEFMLKTIKRNLERISQTIKELEEEINRKVEPFEAKIKKLDTIPGVDKIGAIGLISEIGTDMSVFPSEKELASWAGMCPGNNESAGKKKVVG